MSGSNSSRKPQKELTIKPHNVYTNMYVLVFKEGGKVPERLSGMYKSKAVAQRAIDAYTAGYDRPKIQPRAPRNEAPTLPKKEHKAEKPEPKVEPEKRDSDAEETSES